MGNSISTLIISIVYVFTVDGALLTITCNPSPELKAVCRKTADKGFVVECESIIDGISRFSNSPVVEDSSCSEQQWKEWLAKMQAGDNVPMCASKGPTCTVDFTPENLLKNDGSKYTFPQPVAVPIHAAVPIPAAHGPPSAAASRADAVPIAVADQLRAAHAAPPSRELSPIRIAAAFPGSAGQGPRAAPPLAEPARAARAGQRPGSAADVSRSAAEARPARDRPRPARTPQRSSAPPVRP